MRAPTRRTVLFLAGLAALAAIAVLALRTEAPDGATAGRAHRPAIRDPGDLAAPLTEETPAEEPAAERAPGAVADAEIETDEPPPTRMIEGIVLADRDGRALAGASVTALSGGAVDGMVSSLLGDPHASTVTTADGRFRFPLPVGEVVTVRVDLAGFGGVDRSLRLAPGEDPAEIEIRLRRGGRLVGTVTDPDGRPIPGARIVCAPANEARNLFENPEYVTSAGVVRASGATADPTGAYAIGGLTPGGAYVVRAFTGEHATSGDLPVVIPEDEPRTATLDLRLRRYGAILLRFDVPVDREGEDVETRIEFLDRKREDTVTAEDGRLRLENVEPGDHRLRLRPAGYLAAIVEVPVVPGETAEVDVRLDPGHTLAGVVVDDRGRPLDGAQVHVREVKDGGGILSDTGGMARADREGRFVVEGLRTGTHTARVRAGDLEGFYDGPFLVPGPPVRLIALRYAGLRALLRLPEGAPVPGEIECSLPQLRRKPEVWGRGGGSRVHIEPWNEGRVELDVVQSGAGKLRIRIAGCAPAVVDYEVAPGETADLGEIRLVVGQEIRGRVVDADGNPIAGAEVEAYDGEDSLPHVSTNADGAFRIGHLIEGEIELWVTAEGYLHRALEADTRRASAPLLIRLARGGLLRVRVKHADGHPAASVGATIRPVEGGRDEWGSADERGVITERIPAGRHRVEIRKDGQTLASREVTIEEGGESEVEIVLDR